MRRGFRAFTMMALMTLAGCAITVPVEEKVRLYNEVGLNEFSQGKFDHARECFADALEFTPHDPSLLVNLAQCYDRLGNYPAAEQYYALALQKKPGLVEARYALVMLYYRTGRKADAMRLVQQWLSEQSASPEPYALDGWRLRQEQDLIGARERLMQALGKDPKNAHALTELGIIYETLNLPEYSLVLYEQSLEANPNQPEVNQRLAQLRQRNIGPPRPE